MHNPRPPWRPLLPTTLQNLPALTDGPCDDRDRAEMLQWILEQVHGVLITTEMALDYAADDDLRHPRAVSRALMVAAEYTEVALHLVQPWKTSRRQQEVRHGSSRC